MSTQTEFDVELFELIQFDSDQHDKTCGVTITKDIGNCDCNKVELREAIKAAVNTYVIGESETLSNKQVKAGRIYILGDPQGDAQDRLRDNQRLALWGDK